MIIRHLYIMELRISKLLSSIIRIFLPSNCILCGWPLTQDSEIVHKLCFNDLPQLKKHLLFLLKSEIEDAFFDDIFVPFQFSSSFKILIHYLKYRGFSKIAEIFGRYLSRYIINPDYDVVTSVPLHTIRERERGFNQSAQIAKYDSKETGLLCDNRLLKRLKNNASQTNFDRQKREKNVEGIFKCNREVKQLKILLIDDVITTGSTVNACCKVLHEEGALRIDVAAMATPADILQKKLEYS